MTEGMGTCTVEGRPIVVGTHGRSFKEMHLGTDIRRKLSQPVLRGSDPQPCKGCSTGQAIVEESGLWNGAGEHFWAVRILLVTNGLSLSLNCSTFQVRFFPG